MKTLVIIDMQKGFLRDCQTWRGRVIEEVLSLIKDFRKHQWPILIVEFIGYQDSTTIEEIHKAIKGYEKFVQFVKKNNIDGSNQILSWRQYWDWPLSLVVCGIYGDCCISATVDGIIDKDPRVSIEIREEAIYPKYSSWVSNENRAEHKARVQVVSS